MHSSLEGSSDAPAASPKSGNCKRQGTKPEAQSGMSSFVAIPSCTVRSVFRIGPAHDFNRYFWTHDPKIVAPSYAVSSHSVRGSTPSKPRRLLPRHQLCKRRDALAPEENSKALLRFSRPQAQLHRITLLRLIVGVMDSQLHSILPSSIPAKRDHDGRNLVLVREVNFHSRESGPFPFGLPLVIIQKRRGALQ